MKALAKTPFLVLTLCALTVPIRADEITVSAAASLSDVLISLRADFEGTGTGVNFNFGSSGALQKQIEAGAPVDLFIAAAPKNIAALVQTGDIDGATRRVFARGELVLIAPQGSKLVSFAGLRDPAIRVVAIGGPGVPAGDYARQSLGFLGLKAVLQPKFVFAKDVRAVLNLVAQGNADAGLVYRTDALTSKKVKIVALAPPKSHDPVTYPMALTNRAPNRAGALKFWKFLQGKAAQKTLKRFGFK